MDRDTSAPVSHQQARESSSNANTASIANTDKVKTRSAVAWGITVISLVSLVLSLLGFGVALAIETDFGVPHETVYSSVFDLIGLSVYALLSLVMGLGKITWGPLLEQAWPPALLVAVGTFACTCCLAYLKGQSSRIQTMRRRLRRYLGQPTPNDSTSDLLRKGAAVSGLFGGIVLITPFLLIGALIIITVLISIVPMFGMQAGKSYFRKYVVTPTVCAPVKSRLAMMQDQDGSKPEKKAASPVSSATCVALLKDETQVAIGRVVVSTTGAIVLFEPFSGAVRRIPTNELTVVPVSDIAHASQPNSGSRMPKSN
jgi:VIT1/CCC1 family predicted Fe2+/Mn2+ transporter